MNTVCCKRCGVELWDIQQAGYFAFLEALKGYKPETGYKFITFIRLPFKNAVNDLLKRKTEKQINEPLNNCISLDTPTEDKDGDTDTALINSILQALKPESENQRTEQKPTKNTKRAFIITPSELNANRLTQL